MNDTVLLSLGMGVESVTILMRWMEEPETRPCPIEDLIVVTAQVGNEYEDTRELMEAHVLPRMREHNIRYVQLARKGLSQEDGIVILDDSRQPQRVFLEGVCKLSDEMIVNGIVPQYAGIHRCALKFKAWVIETWMKQHLMPPIRHVIGYNADEQKRIATSEYETQKRNDKAKIAFGFNCEETERIAKANEYDGLRGKKNKVAFGYNADELKRIQKNCEYNGFVRTAFYPLMDWGWSRDKCIEYLLGLTGVVWQKSACVYCPFNALGPDAIERHKRHPLQVADAMVMEHAALAMNPRAGMLYKDKSLIQITIDSGNTAAVEAYRAKLNAMPWALYRVRRIANLFPIEKDGVPQFKKNGEPKMKKVVDRAVEKLQVFDTRDEAAAALDRIGGRCSLTMHNTTYVYVQEFQGLKRDDREEFYTIAPARVETKARYTIEKFDSQWAEQGLFSLLCCGEEAA